MKKGEGEMGGGGVYVVVCGWIFFDILLGYFFCICLKKKFLVKIVSFLYNDVLYIFIYFNDFIKFIIDFFFKLNKICVFFKYVI